MSQLKNNHCCRAVPNWSIRHSKRGNSDHAADCSCDVDSLNINFLIKISNFRGDTTILFATNTITAAERFLTGAYDTAKEGTPTMQLIVQAMLSKEERTRSRTALHHDVTSRHLDQVPLFHDFQQEIEILEMLPHIKRLMTLQVFCPVLPF